MSRVDRYNFTEGSIVDKMILFALPLAFTNILQQLFNSCDIAVVGQFAGAEAMAAVGTNVAPTCLFINLFGGMAIGANVVLAKYIGAKKEDRISDVLHGVIFMAISIGIVLCVLGQFIARPLLTIMGAPPDVLSLAIVYLRIYAIGCPFILLYNYEAAIFRSMGDTRTPLIGLSVAGGINIVFNLIAVIIFRMGVAGVGIATVLYNVIVSLVLMIMLTKRTDAFKLILYKIRPNLNAIKQVVEIGLPSGLQSMFYPISNICIQTCINGLGSMMMAGSAAALNFENMSYYFINAFSHTALTFMGQNYGAGKVLRCRAVYRRAMFLSIVISFCISMIFYICRYPLMGIYSNDINVIEAGIQRLTVVSSLVFLETLFDTPTASMRMFGHSVLPAIFVVTGTCIFRIVWVF
ncbi:MAG: MATE family efflux transporter, partial [Lachnospiraceae bacterium]|nr:MATE family efflux transporter [Lachnospiraceae bacterium]